MVLLVFLPLGPRPAPRPRALRIYAHITRTIARRSRDDRATIVVMQETPTTREAAPMFDDLTPAELGALRSKLYSAGHKFAAAGLTLGRMALEFPALSPQHDAIWSIRQPVADAMTESYDLAESTEAGPR